MASLATGRSPKAVVIVASVLAVGGLVLSPAIGPLAGTRPSPLFFAKLGLAALLVANASHRRN